MEGATWVCLCVLSGGGSGKVGAVRRYRNAGAVVSIYAPVKVTSAALVPPEFNFICENNSPVFELHPLHQGRLAPL